MSLSRFLHSIYNRSKFVTPFGNITLLRNYLIHGIIPHKNRESVWKGKFQNELSGFGTFNRIGLLLKSARCCFILVNIKLYIKSKIHETKTIIYSQLSLCTLYSTLTAAPIHCHCSKYQSANGNNLLNIFAKTVVLTMSPISPNDFEFFDDSFHKMCMNNAP